MKRKYHPWENYPCHVCGCEGATIPHNEHSRPVMIEDGELLCVECEIHAQYEDDSHKIAFAIAFVESITRARRRPWLNFLPGTVK